MEDDYDALSYQVQCVKKWPVHNAGSKQAVGTKRLILNTIQH